MILRLPNRQWYWYCNDYLHIPPPAWPSNGIPAALRLTTDKTTLNSIDGIADAQLIVAVVDNDGNVATYWQAGAGDASAWLSVDLERIVTASTGTLTFPSDGNRPYRVEISDDGETGWRLVSDQTQSANRSAVQALTAVSGARGRFLRVSFIAIPDSKPAALSEVHSLGYSSSQ